MSNVTGPAVRLNPDDLTAFAASIFVRSGVPESDASLWARSLVWANLRGVDTHGVLRIPRYLELIEIGGISPNPDMQVLLSDGAIALLDADRAPGPVGMGRASELAVERAKEANVGWCVARNISHAGAIGMYAEQLSELGLIGIAMTASRPLMAYHGSQNPVLSTNPLAIGVPIHGRSAIFLDMSTATATLGNIMSARRTGQPLGEGWALDEHGSPTTDANAATTLTPMAGPKGSGLSLMIECLASLVAGNPVIAPALNGAKGTNMNGVVIALNPAAFGSLDEFYTQVNELADTIAAQPTAAGTDQLLMPGERGARETKRRRIDGIPLPEGVWNSLLEVADACEVSPPKPILPD